MTATPRRTFVRDQDEPPVDAVDVDAGDGAEQHGRHEERQDQQADRGVRLVDSTTMTVRPNRTMLPPIWVAACDSQRRRNERLRKTARALSPRGRRRRPGRIGRVASSRRRVRSPAVGVARGPVTPAARRGRLRSARRHRGATNSDEPTLQGRPARGGRDARSSGSAARCRRRGGRRATCRRRTGAAAPEADDVAEQQRSGRGGPARPAGYQSRGRP